MPTSFAMEAPHLRERTARIGLLARCLPIFRVDALVLYNESPEEPRREAVITKEILDYVITAPYLRKLLFPVKPHLRYAGILPPLNIPVHPETTEPSQDEVREGLIVRKGERLYVEAGTRAKITTDKKFPDKARVLVHIKKDARGYRYRVLSRRKAQVYAGFKTTILPYSLQEIVAEYDLSIATSRYGEPYSTLKEEMKMRLNKAKRVAIAFGSAKKGLYDIAKLQNRELEDIFDYVVNVIPLQGVRTVRTEEAIFSTLTLISELTNLSSLAGQEQPPG